MALNRRPAYPTGPQTPDIQIRVVGYDVPIADQFYLNAELRIVRCVRDPADSTARSPRWIVQVTVDNKLT